MSTQTTLPAKQGHRIKRYQTLVDREFTGQLTADEAHEMQRLGEEIDRFFAPLYQPAIERLEAELKARRTGRGDPFEVR